MQEKSEHSCVVIHVLMPKLLKIPNKTVGVAGPVVITNAVYDGETDEDSKSDAEITTCTGSKKPKRIYSRQHHNWLINEFNAPSLLPNNIIHLMEEDLDRMIKHVPRPMNKTNKSRSNDRRRDNRRNELRDHIDVPLFRERVIELLNMIEVHTEVQREVQPEVDIKILAKKSLFRVIGYTMNDDVVWIDMGDADDDADADADDGEEDEDVCVADADVDEYVAGGDEYDAGAGGGSVAYVYDAGVGTDEDVYDACTGADADECDAGADASDWELPKNCTFFLDL
jgi:hypothetical protein